MRTNRTVAERVFAAFLSLILVLGMFPVSVMRTSAEEAAPMYGTVDAYTQGLTITGSGSDAVVVSNGEITLDWVAADASIGRVQDGWWVGFKVTAPAGLTEEQLKSAVYGRKPDDMTKSFWDNQNSAQDAQEHYIDLWSFTSDIYLEQNKTSYTWYFCWDGTNVQKVQLKMDPTKIALKTQYGETYRISFGTVEALTQGTANITGNGTAAVTAVQEAAELTYQDGWKVGIKVVAPAGFASNAMFSDVTNGVSDQSFLLNKDGADYIELWLPVSEADLVNKADLTSVYSFDWNGIGVYEQTVTFRVNTSGNIVLKNAAGQQVYPYLYGTATAKDAVITGNTTKNITVDFTGAKVEWDNGLTVSAQVALNGYETVTVSQTLPSMTDTAVSYTKDIDWNGDGLVDQTVKLTGTILPVKADQVAPAFENPSAAFDTKKLYEGAENSVTNTADAVGALSYSISENEYLKIDEKTGKVTVKRDKWGALYTALHNNEAIVVTVTATFAETETHNSSSASYTVSINAKNDDTLRFNVKEDTVVYGETYQQEPVSAFNTNKTVTYTSSDTTVAAVDPQTGVVTPVKAGKVTITATVTYEAGYTETAVSYILNIKKAQQAALTFSNAVYELTYNDYGNVYTNTASGGTTNETIVYKIVSGKDVADINGNTLTIKSAGNVTVEATRPGNECYEDVSREYTLTVNKAQQKITLESASGTVNNSEDTHTINMQVEGGYIATGTDDKGNQIAYQFAIDKDETITEIKAEEVNGNVVITIDEGDYGKAKITITRPGNNCYEPWEGATYELTINQIEANSSNFNFEGNKNANAEDATWYCGPVTITYVENDQQYKVSTKQSKKDKGDWLDEYIVKEDGSHDLSLSLKQSKGEKKNGGIRYGQKVPNFKIDQKAPVSTIIYTETVWGSVFEKLTFGFYDAPTTVKITADDSNGKAEVSGVASIFYKLAGDADFTEYKGSSVVVTIPDQYFGKVEFYAVDNAGNVENQNTSATTIVVDSTAGTWNAAYAYDKTVEEGEAVYTDANGVQYTRFDTTVTLFMDETFFDLSLEELKLTEKGKASAAAPTISGDDSRGEWTKGEDGIWTIDLTLTTEGDHDMVMEYTNRSGLASEKYSQKIVIDRTAPVAQIEWAEAERVEKDGTRYYKNNAEKPATATLTVVDKNFNPDKAVVSDLYEAVNGTQETKSVPAVWTQDEQDSTKWTAVVTLTEEGVHNLTVDVTDWAGNVMETKTTDKVIIDYTAPVLEELKFSGAALQNTKDGRNYYNAVTTVTVTVTERNFDEKDLQITLKAQDVTGADTEASYTMGEWKHEGDKHTVDLTFATDANFALDVSYTDMAANAGNDVEEKLFTVDKVAPEVGGITYSKSLKDVIIEKITFSYYQAPVEVTLTVTDDTAGVQRFDYSALLNENVSGVNAGIDGATATDVKQEGKTFTVTFKVPAEALTNKNQFNGYVEFTATDWSANTSAKKSHKEEQSLVVDNIAPKATITYNAPVQTVDKVAYYNQEITAIIAIDEANFFSEDVQVTVTRDGVNHPVNVKWTKANGDVHNGTFTLTQDGDYIIKVTYTDRSGNVMTEYTSHQLTLDTVLPTVEVTNVVANSANTDEVYTFDITASDINIDMASFKPVLTGIFRDEDGKFYTETIDLGNIKVVKEKETYTFTVENLEEDAVYSLTCSVSDLAGNTYEKMMLLSDEKEYEEVQFSINRDGSTYMPDENTASLVGKYYVQNVLEDVVLIEINPDVLKNHSVTLNGRELVEGMDYEVDEEGGNGSWMQYTYTVSKGLMADESEYNLVVSSEDKAGNKAFSDVKGANITFVVDRTAPVVTVTGMHNDGRYQVESQTVTLIPMDAGGALRSLSVYLVDDEGNVLQQLVDLSGQDLYDALEENENQITFQIEEGLYQNVRIVCNDMAVDEEGNTNTYDETFTNISVSTSGFMMFWANKPLRYGVIFGLLGLLLLLLLLLGKKKKKEA